MSESTTVPLARLVLFMVCLAIAGSLLAGFSYYTVALPEQKNVKAPANTLITCPQYCDAQYYSCIPSCKRSSDLSGCRSDCLEEYNTCKQSC